MSRTFRAAAIVRPLERPLRKALPAPRFAPIRLDGLASNPRNVVTPVDAVIEIVFPDGSVLRAARDTDPAALERLVGRFLRRTD